MLLGLIFFSSANNAQQVSVEKSLASCRGISNSESRLDCYDQIGSKVNTSFQTGLQPQLKMPVLLADLEEPRIFAAYGRMDFLNENNNTILLGVGTRAKLKTIKIPKIRQSVDFNMIGLIKSQFDVSELSTRNNRGGALINTDFMIGGELVKNFSQGNLRLQYKHQSFHLGDEFLIDNPFYLENRLNLSYETIDLLAFRKLNNWGTYFGTGFIVRSEPGNLAKIKLQTGVQYHGVKREWFTPIFGLDFKSWGESNWHLNTSIKAGVEFYGFLDQPLQLMFEYSEGKSPYGQFINEDFEFFGLSINHFW